MKKLFTLLFLFALTLPLSAQVNVSWVQNTAGVSIAVDNSNNVYTVNYEYNPAGDITQQNGGSSTNFTN